MISVITTRGYAASMILKSFLTGLIVISFITLNFSLTGTYIDHVMPITLCMHI